MDNEEVESYGAQSPWGGRRKTAEFALAYVVLDSQEPSHVTAEVLGMTGVLPEPLRPSHAGSHRAVSTNTSTAVSTRDTMMGPKQPRRLLKKKNTDAESPHRAGEPDAIGWIGTTQAGRYGAGQRQARRPDG